MKITIIGVGRVGSTIAYTLLHRKWKGEIILIDSDKNKLFGEYLDLSHANMGFNSEIKIDIGKFKDIKNSDIIIISAGFSRNPNQTMENLGKKNKPIIEKICKEVSKYSHPNSKVIMITNPAESMKEIAEKYFDNVLIPDHKLDYMRFFYYKKWELVKNAGQTILSYKGYTNWGVAIAVIKLIFYEKKNQNYYRNRRYNRKK